MPGDIPTAHEAASGAKGAAKATAGSLLDLFLGVLLPIGLFVAGWLMGQAIGGGATIGNVIYGISTSTQSGVTGTSTLTSAQIGTFAGLVTAGIWGIPAGIFWAYSHSIDGKVGKWIMRGFAAFFTGLVVFNLGAAVQMASGNSTSTQVYGANGGAVDQFFGQITSFAKGIGPKPAGSS